MESEAQELHPVVEAYKEQFGHAHHLDRMTLATFAIVAFLVVALTVIVGLGISEGVWRQFAVSLLAMVLAVAGTHMVIANAADYWVTFVVIAQMTRGLGLVQRGLFPASLLAQAPLGLTAFVLRLIGGFRGPLLLVYLALGWYSAFLAVSQWLDVPLSFGLALLPPFILAVTSAAFYYKRLRYQMVALKRHEELVAASRDDLVGSHCNLAEALLWLDPPRLLHAQRQYELALEIESDNPRAKEGLQRVLAWKGKGLGT